jgi:hypothetical protein
MRFGWLFQTPSGVEKMNVRKDDGAGIHLNGEWHALDYGNRAGNVEVMVPAA